jgi:leader peptidase (prepilin peptidase) / N-methyltransferase
MTAAFAALVLGPALAVGSFLNVVAARVPLKQSVVHPRSACPKCGTQLAWYDNIPLVSWVVLRGRCRTCATSIAATYPLVELATGLLVVGCVLRFGVTPMAALGAAFCAVLVVLSAIDIEHRKVPNRIVVPAAALALIAHTAIAPSPEWALGAVGAAGFLFVLALAYPAGMGMGDVKLALLLGAVLGRTVPIGILLGTVAALVPSVVLFSRHGSAARKMAIPFVPFLALGSVVALFAGHELLGLYTSHL